MSLTTCLLPDISPLDRSNHDLYLITTDTCWANDLAAQLNYFNYTLHIFNKWPDFLNTVSVTIPAAILLDIQLLDQQKANWLNDFKIAHTNSVLPIIYFSKENSITEHLRAIRASGDAFYVKPGDIMILVAKLDLLCGIKQADPFRVLIIEDTVSLSNYYAFILQQVGIESVIVNNPLQINQPLIEFKPDIILMDVYMPECSGMELASIIRQQDVFANIPILYLSSEADKSKQSKAMGLGGDDFLNKPIVPQDLIAVVQWRARRARILGSMISKDSLTGLLKHTAIQEHLYKELVRAERNTAPLSFAMIDLDHFKSINDTYGHQVGDLVITSLCRLLIKRLRNSDIAGRYGGEEFSLILPDTNSDNAMKLCDEIRDSFAQLSFTSNGNTFNAAFSCGISSYPAHSDVVSMVAAADNALYNAKHAGRNQISSCG